MSGVEVGVVKDAKGQRQVEIRFVGDDGTVARVMDAATAIWVAERLLQRARELLPEPEGAPPVRVDVTVSVAGAVAGARAGGMAASEKPRPPAPRVPIYGVCPGGILHVVSDGMVYTVRTGEQTAKCGHPIVRGEWTMVAKPGPEIPRCPRCFPR
jgi:hypothetical protein